MRERLQPSISIIIPVFNSSAELRRCLDAIRASSLEPHEVLVVDDGSTEDIASIVHGSGAVLLTAAGRRGPAAARNHGATQASGDVLLFIDVDVLVHRDSVAKVALAFTDPGVHAVIGSYDHAPASKEFLSQYRNLMHHYTHQTGSPQATTFWSGCGAIRREVFLRMSGFDAAYRRPAIEDIELGYRLSAAGYSIVLDPRIQVTHLKRWSLTKMVKTDVFDRGIPWTLLILRAGRMPDDLNLRWTQRLSVAIAGFAMLLGILATVQSGGRFLTPMTGTLLLCIGSFWVSEAVSPGSTAVRVALASTLAVYSILAFLHELTAAIFLIAGGYSFLFVREAVGSRLPRWRRRLGFLYGVYLVFALAYMVRQIPNQPVVMVLAGLVCLNLILNARFYAFLFSQLGRLCTLAAIPFHFLYHLYSGISFTIGAIQYLSERQDTEAAKGVSARR
jgi:GT2 family glycosyltransferase